MFRQHVCVDLTEDLSGGGKSFNISLPFVYVFEAPKCREYSSNGGGLDGAFPPLLASTECTETFAGSSERSQVWSTSLYPAPTRSPSHKPSVVPRSKNPVLLRVPSRKPSVRPSSALPSVRSTNKPKTSTPSRKASTFPTVVPSKRPFK